jgi:membrane protein DedA with SNARE-associated domain
MTLKKLCIPCVLGGFLWALIIIALAKSGLSWVEITQYALMIMVGVVLLGAIWLGVEKDQHYLDELERQREAEGLDAEEYEQPLPPAA